MLVRQNYPSVRANRVRHSNDFTDLGTLEANSWFIESKAICAAAPTDAGTPLAVMKRKNLPAGKCRSRDRRNSPSRSNRRELRSSRRDHVEP
jgi:hypothetical protein